MKFGQKLTVSLLSVLMLSGIGATGVNASTKSQSDAQVVKELETRPKVEKSSNVKVAKPAKHKRRNMTAKNAKLAKQQTKHQIKNTKKVRKHIRKHAKRNTKRRARKRVATKRIKKNSKKRVAKRQSKPARQSTNWYNDGLSRRDLSARDWVSSHESGHHWNILSYGGVCVGYFQLSPGYLGYKNGHVNLDHAHQVKAADHYAKARYGGWVNAQRFWQAHHWY